MNHYSDIVGFFDKFAPLENYYDNLTFSLIAFREGDGYSIWRARLQFNLVQVEDVPIFRSQNIFAARYSISDLNMDALELVTRLITGETSVKDIAVHFRPTSTGRFETEFVQSNQEFDKQQKRVSVLSIAGDVVTMPAEPRDIDWELKSSETPFDSLTELANLYLVNPVSNGIALLEVIGFNAVEVDMESGVVEGKATIGLIAAKSFPPEKISLGYRVMLQSGPRTDVIKRGRNAPGEMEWSEKRGLQLGTTVLDLPVGAMVHCIANFEGVAQHHYYIGDPQHHPNTKRTVFELFDPTFQSLKEMLFTSPGRGRGDAKSFEIAVGSVFWMLGFGVSNIGYQQKTSDAPDLIATTPSGHFLIVECTTGLLKADSKLARLVARTFSVRSSLERSSPGRRALPVMITQKTRAEVAADIPDAEKNGILVITADDFDRLLDRTIFRQDVDAAFVEAELKVSRAMERHELRSDDSNGA